MDVDFIFKIAAIGIEDYCKGIKYTGKDIVTPPNYDEVIEYVRTSGGEIIKNKQATYYAVSVSVCSIVESLFTGKDYIMTVSSMMHLSSVYAYILHALMK